MSNPEHTMLRLDVWGFKLIDYYRDASSSRFITSVRVPLLCLNAVDDPIAPGECIPYDECEFNPHVILGRTCAS